MSIVTLEAACARCGVDPSSADAVDLWLLLQTVESAVRDITGRSFEGVATVYSQIVRVHGGNLILPAAPVTDVLSVARVDWDGQETAGIYEPTTLTGGASTTLAATAAIGASNIKVASVTGLTAGDVLAVGAGVTREVVRVTSVGTAGAVGTGVDVEPVLRWSQSSGATVVEVVGSGSWSLWDGDRGLLALRVSPERVRVVWRVSGAVPAGITSGILDWVFSRWSAKESGIAAGQTGYNTGQDSESWDAARIGQPPNSALLAFLSAWRPSGGGVI